MMRCCATSNAPAAKRPRPRTPLPCIYGTRCPASASCSAWGSSTPSMLSPAAPGGRPWSPRAAWSHGPRQQPGNAWALPAARAARPIARGPLLKPPSWSCATLQRRSHPSPVWSKNPTPATPCRCWPRRGLGRSLPCANARGLARGSTAANAKEGEGMSLGPHWTTMGRTCTRRSTRRAPRRLCTPRRREVARPCAWRPCLDLRSRSCALRGESLTAGVGCPSPAPGAHGTTRRVEPDLCIGRDEGAEMFRGRRALQTRLCPRRAGGASTSRRVWGSPIGSAPADGHQVRPRDRLLPAPGLQRRKK
jgi:hypothetical protein